MISYVEKTPRNVPVREKIRQSLPQLMKFINATAGGTVNLYVSKVMLNPILHTAWLNNHALTLKSNTAKYYFGEKSSFLHTFLKICGESRKIKVKLKKFQFSML
jgi:hypothetical protein